MERRINFQTKKHLYDTLKTVIQFRAVKGSMYLKIYLLIISLAKEMFIYELEQGEEVFISSDLSQRHLPYGFRYYDPILAIVAERITDASRQVIKLRQDVAYFIHNDGDIKRKVLTKLGILEDKNKQKLSFKHSTIYKNASLGINHHMSEHTMML